MKINDDLGGNVGFKKPKVRGLQSSLSFSSSLFWLTWVFQKKKKLSNRRAPDSELYDDHEKMEVEQVVPLVRNLDVNFVDDDELQAALARSRKAKLHKTKKISPEDLAKRSEASFTLLSFCVS